MRQHRGGRFLEVTGLLYLWLRTENRSGISVLGLVAGPRDATGYRPLSRSMSEQPTPQHTAQETVTAQFRLAPPSYQDAPAVYSNFAQATIAQHDLTLFFGWFATPPL